MKGKRVNLPYKLFSLANTSQAISKSLLVTEIPEISRNNIIELETLCISIRRSKDIKGITVDTEEMKLGLFPNDLTDFPMNDIFRTCTSFWRMFRPQDSLLRSRRGD